MAFDEHDNPPVITMSISTLPLRSATRTRQPNTSAPKNTRTTAGRSGNPAGATEKTQPPDRPGGPQKGEKQKMDTTKMNPVVKTVAWLIAGTLGVVMTVVIGMVILGVGKAHATQTTATYAVVYAQRGGHGYRA
jgi:hypothetical protein